MGSEEGNGASQHPCSLDVALRKMEELERRLNILEGKMPLMVTNTVRQEIKPEVIEPVADVLLHKVVKEELQLIEEKLGGTRNVMPKEMILQLKFLVEVSDTIQTGKVIKGKNDECLQLALVDATRHIVSSGPGSSARVEILLLDATSGNEYDDENELTRENFERRIIREGDKTRPHFTRSFHIHLVKGVGVLTGVKLGHDSGWTKNCNCRLGARIVQKFSGVDVRETWTAPFKVVDRRSTYYKKSERPSPSSKVWKLKKIGRAGPPCKRLKDKKIETVLDFLFWHSVNDKELQEEILEAGDGNWQTTVTHAKTCIVDDKSMYSHKSSTVPQTAVVYDAIGKLKGLIHESHFVPVDDLSADKKDHAHKLLRSVLEPSIFVERYKTLFDDEASLPQQFPYRSSENIHGHDQTIGPASSSQTQSIIASYIYDSGPSDSLASQEMGELRDHSLCVFPDPENIDGDTPTDLDNENHENHCFPTDKADSQELLASFVDLYDPQQQLSGTSELVGESSSRRSNASFHSINSTMNSLGESSGCWRRDDDDNIDWFHSINSLGDDDIDWRRMRHPSPNPMLRYADDTYSYNTRIHRDDEPRGDEGVAEPQVTTNPPNRWKRLWLSFREKMSLDVARISHKKPRVG